MQIWGYPMFKQTDVDLDIDFAMFGVVDLDIFDM
jgi:hypothetical protein